MKKLFLSIVLFVTLTGCASSTETAAPAAKEGTCNDLSNGAEAVTIMNADSTPPPATGGTIAEGTYVLAKATVHNGPGGATGPTAETRQMTVRFAGDKAESVFDGVNRSATVTVRGNSVHTSTTCPSTSEEDQDFSATASTFSVHTRRNKGTLVLDFVKR